MKQYLAIDNGGTFIKYGLFDRSGEIVSQGKSATPKRDASEEVYFTVLDEIVARFQGDICGICFSTPGRVEENGILQTAGALPYLAGRNLKELASARYGLPVSVENDGKCAALAEYWKGSLRGVKNGAVLVIGTGIGGGLILNGKLFRGSHGSAAK